MAEWPARAAACTGVRPSVVLAFASAPPPSSAAAQGRHSAYMQATNKAVAPVLERASRNTRALPLWLVSASDTRNLRRYSGLLGEHYGKAMAHTHTQCGAALLDNVGVRIR